MRARIDDERRRGGFAREGGASSPARWPISEAWAPSQSWRWRRPARMSSGGAVSRSRTRGGCAGRGGPGGAFDVRCGETAYSRSAARCGGRRRRWGFDLVAVLFRTRSRRRASMYWAGIRPGHAFASVRAGPSSGVAGRCPQRVQAALAAAGVALEGVRSGLARHGTTPPLVPARRPAAAVVAGGNLRAAVAVGSGLATPAVNGMRESDGRRRASAAAGRWRTRGGPAARSGLHARPCAVRRKTAPGRDETREAARTRIRAHTSRRRANGVVTCSAAELTVGRSPQTLGGDRVRVARAASVGDHVVFSVG